MCSVRLDLDSLPSQDEVPNPGRLHHGDAAPACPRRTDKVVCEGYQFEVMDVDSYWRLPGDGQSHRLEEARGHA